MMFQEYYQKGVREICHDVKQYDDMERHNRAISVIVRYMVSLGIVNSSSLLIPSPQHTGKAEYTKEICIGLAKLTGAAVADVLCCRPHRPLYEMKIKNEPCQIDKFMVGKLLPKSYGKIYFVDNVMATGKTFLTAQAILGKSLKPLVYAVDYGKLSDAGILYGHD